MKCHPKCELYFDISSRGSVVNIKLHKLQVWNVIYYSDSVVQIYRNNVMITIDKTKFDNLFEITEGDRNEQNSTRI